MSNATNPGAWTTARIIETLATRNAICAMRGRPCPNAARVLARLEGGAS